MPFDEEIQGDPFRGDYPGRTDHQPWDELEARVQRKVIDLARRRHEPAHRHEVIRLLTDRRAGEPPEPGTGSSQQHAGGAVAPIDSLPVEAGFDTLLTPGELLITGQSYDGRLSPAGGPGQGPSAKAYLDVLGMVVSNVECAELHGRVLRLTPPEGTVMSTQQHADLARVLRARGFNASLSYITPTAPIIKGLGAPEPVDPPAGPARFGDGHGTPARVAIIDTGISDQDRTDGWLDGVGGDVDPLYRFPLRNPDPYLDLAAGHGTFVAGVVRQVAPRAEVTVYQAVDSDGIASEVAVACEMIRAVKEGNAQIINLSLGCQTHDNLPPIAIAAALEVIEEWERENDREVLIVAAAGNYADDLPCWPAAFRRVVSVGGLAPDMLPAPWSSHGFWVTCSAIAQGVRSTFVEGRESPLVDPVPHDFGRNAWAAWSGTSFSAPQIAGAVARLHEEYGYPMREAAGRLLAAGRPVPGFGRALRILPGM
jgi:subtilisin family serine protease